MKESTKSVIEELLRRKPELNICADSISETVDMLIECFSNGNKLLVCGNGGSAADSMHIVGELLKGFVLPRRLSETKQAKLRSACSGETADFLIEGLQDALPAISLVSETSLMTAFSNDCSSELVFAQQVLGLGSAGDVLLAISTSGNSANVVYAASTAKAFGIKVIGLTGASGGRLVEIADQTIRAPEKETYLIQEYHLSIYHAVCLAIENEIYGENDTD